MYDGELNCMGTVRSGHAGGGQWDSTVVSIFRFFCAVGHHEDEFPIERLDVNISGDCC